MRQVRFVSILVLVVMLGASSAFPIIRVARRLNSLQLYGGPTITHGEYHGIPGTDNVNFVINNRLVDVPADNIYGTGYHLGINYGQLRNSRSLISVGFQFSDYNLNDTIPLPLDTIITFGGEAKLRQYDVQIGADYFLTDVGKTPLTPYVGIGVRGGIGALSVSGFNTETKANLATFVSFGADVTVWKSPVDGSMMTLSLASSWSFLATSDRPRQVQIGAAFRYWFRP